MAPKRRCSKCGAAISEAVAGGFCAACLLQEALPTAEPAPNPRILRYFGDYELLEEIARGGMGVVFKARQRSLNRIVAVKMILSGHLATSAQAQRFRTEARAAAALQHPGIVAIHEIGEHEGLLFFSMDYVQGQTLAQQVRDAPWVAGRAARCVRDIAEAIQYAHERGVLHRDLKPSNVLLDADEKPHITDFGLAKPLNGDGPLPSADAHLTLSGQVLGSPSFMPPEQAAGRQDELSAASDVYSLGAVLYHCLTCRPPFVAETLVQTLRMVAEQEPVSPRLLNAGVPRDLETICLKCLEKDPKRRYPSARDLADELGRFLHHEPIHARPASLVLKVHRWCVRNKPLAIAGTAILALLLVVAIGSPIAALRINRERRRAEIDAAKAQAEAAKSGEVITFMTDMLKGVGPAVALGKDTQLLKDILDRTAQRLTTDLTNQPGVEAELRTIIGEVYEELGEPAKATELYRKALSLWETLPNAQKESTRTLNDLGVSLSHQNLYPEAEVVLQKAIALRKRHWGERPAVTIPLNNLAVVFKRQGKHREAEELLQEALNIMRKHQGENHQDTAAALNNLAGVLKRTDRVAEAEKLYRQALTIHRKQLGEHPDVATTLNNLAGVLLDQDRFAEAEERMREALAMRKKLLGEHPEVAWSLHNLAALLGRQGKFVDAETLLLNDRQQPHQSALYEQASLQALILLYEAWDEAAPGTGKSARAEEWRKKLEALERKADPAAETAR